MPKGFRSAGGPAPLLDQFGANLRAARETAGMTSEQLAEGAGLGLELLIELEEAGGAIPSIGLFLRLVGTLGVRPSALVAGVDWVPFTVIEGDGTFEVLEDAGLVDEIEALKEALPRGRASHEE
jgi:transcriptional regulator with XRE-family HTH domain